MSALPLHRISLREISNWGGEAFWVYDHVLAARPGALLLVPVHLVDGSLKDLCALCPVPFESALAVMDQDKRLAFRDLVQLQLAEQARWPLVQELTGPGLWHAAQLPELRSTVYLHEFGTRLAVVDEFRITETVRGV